MRLCRRDFLYSCNRVVSMRPQREKASVPQLFKERWPAAGWNLIGTDSDVRTMPSSTAAPQRTIHLYYISTLADTRLSACVAGPAFACALSR